MRNRALSALSLSRTRERALVLWLYFRGNASTLYCVGFGSFLEMDVREKCVEGLDWLPV